MPFLLSVYWAFRFDGEDYFTTIASSRDITMPEVFKRASPLKKMNLSPVEKGIVVGVGDWENDPFS